MEKMATSNFGVEELIDLEGVGISDKFKIKILKEIKNEKVEIHYYDNGKGLDFQSEKRMVEKFAPKFANIYVIMRDEKFSDWHKAIVVRYFFVGRDEMNKIKTEAKWKNNRDYWRIGLAELN